MQYECDCERQHTLDGESVEAALSGYSTDLECECGAVYAISVTMLKSPRGS
jgi:hypothetical protein